MLDTCAATQLFGYRSVWCGEIEGASQRCPPGESCPDLYDCFVDCSASELGQWIEVRGVFA